MFWQFHNLLYNNQTEIDSGWISKDNLKKLASKIVGLDVKNSIHVEKDIALGASFDFHDTPNFIIGNSDGSNAKIIR
jgi:protein-disulfide isomerase